MEQDRPIAPAGALKQLAVAVGADGGTPASDQRSITHALCRALIRSSADLPPHRTMVTLADGSRQPLLALERALLDAMWPDPKTFRPDADPLPALMEKLNGITDPAIQRSLAATHARFGHMHQMAGLLLRDFELEKSNRTTAEGFLDGRPESNSATLPYTSAARAVAALNRPRFELTLTAHPTNTNTQASMTAQRELAKALSDWRTNPSARRDVRAALRAYAQTPLLPERTDARPGFTVLEEARTMLYHFNTLYEDLDRVYASYDAAMGKRFDGMRSAAYQPETLKLNIGLNSWGSSGDKDGNKLVTADTTLYGLAQHYQQVLMRYRAELEQLPGSLDAWKDRIDAALTATHRVVTETETLLKQPGHLSEEQHDALRNALQGGVKDLDAKAFITDLEQAYQTAEGDAQPRTLNLLRHVRTFGMSFGTIEYRETAEEFHRIVTDLIPLYDQLDEPGRLQALTKAMSSETALDECRQRLAELSYAEDGKPYSKDDTGPIAYHTRKRLELAREFPEAIQNHVLAECQQASNLMELLLLQKLVTNGKNHAPKLGIIPLFEDSDTLQAAPAILRAAIEQPAYRQHLDRLAQERGSAAAQQVQLAHSDNARRNGLPAARGLIYRAHDELRQLFHATQPPIQLQFYEGGSLSDSYRGGGRSPSAAINEFALHGFTKFTVQGGDMLNYLNIPDSAFRLFMRNISHNASRLDGHVISNPTGSMGNESPVIDALIATKDEYKQNFFYESRDGDFVRDGDGNPIGNKATNAFLDANDFVRESSDGNASSRAGARTNGTAHADITTVRTIGLSEGTQHTGLNPSWIGSRTLADELKKRGINSESPTLLQQYYKRSPIFKDTVDRLLYGLLRTDIPYLDDHSGHHALVAERLAPESTAALTLALEAYTGKPIQRLTHGRELAALSPDEQHQLLIDEVYPHVHDVLADQDRFIGVARQLKAHWTPDEKEDHGRLRMRLHNALDTIYHGRIPQIDDTTYATEYCRNHGIKRPHVDVARGISA